MSQDVCVLDCTLKVSVPQLQNFWNVPTTFVLWPCFLPKQQFSNEKIWCLETKLWLKVIFFQCVQGYAEISVWFVHVTDCYCFGKRNLNKFFLTTKLPLVQSYPIFMGNNFGCASLTETHAQWNSCFCIWKREAVVVQVCNIGPMWLWYSILFRKNIENCLMLPHLMVHSNLCLAARL